VIFTQAVKERAIKMVNKQMLGLEASG